MKCLSDVWWTRWSSVMCVCWNSSVLGRLQGRGSRDLYDCTRYRRRRNSHSWNIRAWLSFTDHFLLLFFFLSIKRLISINILQSACQGIFKPGNLKSREFFNQWYKQMKKTWRYDACHWDLESVSWLQPAPELIWFSVTRSPVLLGLSVCSTCSSRVTFPPTLKFPKNSARVKRPLCASYPCDV